MIHNRLSSTRRSDHPRMDGQLCWSKAIRPSGDGDDPGGAVCKQLGQRDRRLFPSLESQRPSYFVNKQPLASRILRRSPAELPHPLVESKKILRNIDGTKKAESRELGGGVQ